MNDLVENLEKCFYEFKKDVKTKQVSNNVRHLVNDVEITLESLITALERGKTDGS